MTFRQAADEFLEAVNACDRRATHYRMPPFRIEARPEDEKKLEEARERLFAMRDQKARERESA